MTLNPTISFEAAATLLFRAVRQFRGGSEFYRLAEEPW
jgi:hypothetical protein